MQNGADRWSDLVQFPGQELSAYIDALDRRLRFTFDDWGAREVPLIERSQITGIEVVTPDGHAQTIDFGPKLDVPAPVTVKVPRLSCGDQLRYRVLSDRFETPRAVSFLHGYVRVPPQKCLMDLAGSGDHCLPFVFAPVVSLGVTARAAIAGVPSATFAARPYASGRISSEVRPWGDWYFVEYGYMATLGGREYVLASGASLESQASFYGRLGVEVAAGLRTARFRPLLPALHLGAGLTAGYGHVMDPGTGSAIRGDWFLSPFMLVQVDRVAGIFRVFVGEKVDELNSFTGNLMKAYASFPLGFEARYTFY